MTYKKSLILMLALCLLLSLCGCSGSSEDSAPQAAEDGGDALVEYASEGVGVFYLPEGFSQNVQELTEPLPSTLVEFEKDGWYITAHRFGADHSQAIIGLQMACAYVGTTFVPPLFGWIAERVSIGLLPAFLFAGVAGMLLCAERVSAVCGR